MNTPALVANQGFPALGERAVVAVVASVEWSSKWSGPTQKLWLKEIL